MRGVGGKEGGGDMASTRGIMAKLSSFRSRDQRNLNPRRRKRNRIPKSQNNLRSFSCNSNNNRNNRSNTTNPSLHNLSSRSLFYKSLNLTSITRMPACNSAGDMGPVPRKRRRNLRSFISLLRSPVGRLLHNRFLFSILMDRHLVH